MLQLQKLNSLLQNRTDVQASKTAKKTSADEGLFTGLSRAIQHAISFTHTLHRMEDTCETCVKITSLSRCFISSLVSGVIKLMPPDGKSLAWFQCAFARQFIVSACSQY